MSFDLDDPSVNKPGPAHFQNFYHRPGPSQPGGNRAHPGLAKSVIYNGNIYRSEATNQTPRCDGSQY